MIKIKKGYNFRIILLIASCMILSNACILESSAGGLEKLRVPGNNYDRPEKALKYFSGTKNTKNAERSRLQLERAEQVSTRIIGAARDNFEEYRNLIKNKLEIDIKSPVNNVSFNIEEKSPFRVYSADKKITFLLDFIETLDDDELAYAIGHEFNHLQIKSDNEEAGSGFDSTLKGLLLLRYPKIKEDIERRSQAEEDLSDEAGIFLALKAGFDPSAANTAFEKTAAFKSPNLLPEEDKEYEAHPDPVVRKKTIAGYVEQHLIVLNEELTIAMDSLLRLKTSL